MAPSQSSDRWEALGAGTNDPPSRRRPVAELVDSPEFTVAFAWGLVFLGVAVPLLLVCVRHLLTGEPLAACAIAAVSLPLAGVCLQQARTNLQPRDRIEG